MYCSCHCHTRKHTVYIIFDNIATDLVLTSLETYQYKRSLLSNLHLVISFSVNSDPKKNKEKQHQTQRTQKEFKCFNIQARHVSLPFMFDSISISVLCSLYICLRTGRDLYSKYFSCSNLTLMSTTLGQS